MKSYLNDIIAHTSGLGFFDLVKVTGTEGETSINAIAQDKSVILSGKFKIPNSQFSGVFGMPNLAKLNTIVGFSEYDEDAKITVTYRDTDKVADTIHFETKNGDFVNDYRLMSKELAEERVKSVTYKGTGWDVEFEPHQTNVQRLKKQAQANNEETTFTTKVENGDLKVFFGDPSTHSGNLVLQSGVTGSLTKTWAWPVKQVLSILALPGDKTYRINDKGATEILVDSGMATYSYLLPASVK
jgi:hypothetical protein